MQIPWIPGASLEAVMSQGLNLTSSIVGGFIFVYFVFVLDDSMRLNSNSMILQ
jgi:hypothetical protein